MPSLGADMTEGTVLEWLVAPGDLVHRGDIVAVVDTTKSAVEVECFDDGVVDSLDVEPGTKVAVGTVLAHLAPPGGADPRRHRRRRLPTAGCCGALGVDRPRRADRAPPPGRSGTDLPAGPPARR